MRHYTESGRLYLDAFNLFGMTNYFYFSFAVKAEIGVGKRIPSDPWDADGPATTC